MRSTILHPILSGLVGAICVSACGKAGHEISSETGAAPAPVGAANAAPTPLTNAQWREAFEKSYVATNRKDDSGVETFSACFGDYRPEEKVKCSGALFEGRRDAFKKAYRFKSLLGAWNEQRTTYSMTPSGYLGFAILMPECDPTSTVIARARFGADGWMFLQSFAVLADGTVRLEKQFSSDAVSREILGRGVTEMGAVALSSAEVNALPALLAAKDVHIRLTGDKGYVTLTTKQVADFLKEVREVQAARAVVDQSLKPLSDRSCST